MTEDPIRQHSSTVAANPRAQRQKGTRKSEAGLVLMGVSALRAMWLLTHRQTAQAKPMGHPQRKPGGGAESVGASRRSSHPADRRQQLQSVPRDQPLAHRP